MPKRQEEAKFKTRLIDGFKKYWTTARAQNARGWQTHVIASTMAKWGVPDLVFGLNGQVLWVEAKVGDNQLSSYQRFQQEQMVLAGLNVWTLTDAQDAEHVVAETLVPHGAKWDLACRTFGRGLADAVLWDALFGRMLTLQAPR